MKKFLKISGITIAILIIIAFIGMKAMGISPLGMGMHDEIIQEDGIAIGGYDPVAYFNSNEAIKGSSEFTYEWNGAKWQFSSAENMEIFKNEPDNHCPAYGGHCSFAIGKGFAAPTDPTIWSIENGKLLFYSNEEVKADALADIDNVISEGDKNWK